MSAEHTTTRARRPTETLAAAMAFLADEGVEPDTREAVRKALMPHAVAAEEHALVAQLARQLVRHRYALEVEPGEGGEPMLLQARRVGAGPLTPGGHVTVHDPANDLQRGLEALAARIGTLEREGKL